MPATRLKRPGRSSSTTVTSSSSAVIRRSPDRSQPIWSSLGKASTTMPAASPPDSTWATRSTSWRTSSAFHGPQADGPVARESASVRAASRSSRIWDPTASATRSMVAGSSRSRLVATSGSSRWCSIRAATVSTSAPGKPIRVVITLGQFDAGRHVVARAGLADVVQQCGDVEQVGPLGAVGQPGGLGDRLEQVPIDGVAVVGVVLGSVADHGPLRKDALPDAALIERFDDADGGGAAGEKVGQQPSSLRRPRLGERRGGCRQPLEGLPVRSTPGGRRRRPPGGEARRVVVGDELVVGRVVVVFESDLTVAQADAVGDRATEVAATAERGAQRHRHPPPGVIARPGDPASGLGDGGHELVAPAVAERFGDFGLLLQYEHVAGPSGLALKLDSGREQHRIGGRELGHVGLEQDAVGRLSPDAGNARRGCRPGLPSDPARAGRPPRRP